MSDAGGTLLAEVPGGVDELRKEVKHDYSSSHDGIVPLSVRRGTWTHHVPLWVTLYAGFSYMALGSELYTYGYGLGRLLGVVAVSALCYLAYAIPAAYLGAWRGQTQALMTRSVFGRVGSWLVSILVLVTPLGWVGFQANALASIWNGLYGWGPVTTIGIIIAVVGITNNVFGFTGISAFARWVAAPVTVLWVGWMVIKGLTATSGSVLHSHVHVAAATPYVVGVTIAIGFATYGNEPDLFRYAKPRLRSVVPPLAIGLLVGQLLFPVAGWIIAARVRSGDLGQSVSGAVSFSLFGLSILAFLLATATQVAVNDANYYESLNAGQNLLGGWSRWRRIYTCLLIAAGGGFMAWWVPQSLDNFFRAVTFLAVTVPTATVIMYTDQLLLPRLLGIRRHLDRVPSWNQAALANWPGIIALVVAIAFGSYGSGILPGQSGSPLSGWGIVPVEAWALGGFLYTLLAAVVARSASRERLLGFPREASPEPQPVPVIEETPVPVGAAERR
ncbi:MAG TPA: cytosine permease [Solirubrobacteraceae bacterium]|nr:cytosine permease [Solirubrobacteraceae bacterium]